MMRRRRFTALAAASLTFCVATAAFWIGGFHWSPSSVWRETRPLTEKRYAVVLGQGAVGFDVLTPPSQPPPQAMDVSLGFGRVSAAAYVRSADGGPHTLIGDITSYLVPFWFIVLVTAVLPAWWAAPLVRSKFIIPAGHCRGCGYDLRATPERCPECGAVRSA